MATCFDFISDFRRFPKHTKTQILFAMEQFGPEVHHIGFLAQTLAPSGHIIRTLTLSRSHTSFSHLSPPNPFQPLQPSTFECGPYFENPMRPQHRACSRGVHRRETLQHHLALEDGPGHFWEATMMVQYLANSDCQSSPLHGIEVWRTWLMNGVIVSIVVGPLQLSV